MHWIFLPFLLGWVEGSNWSPDMGCTAFPGIHLGLCSGRGDCVLDLGNGTVVAITQPNVPNSRCICHPGWTGINDFVNMDTHDCGQNLIVLRTIYCIILGTTLYELGFIGKKLYQCYRTWKEQSERIPADDTERTTTTDSGSEKESSLSQKVNNANSKLHPQSPTSTLAANTSPHLERTKARTASWRTMLAWPVITTCVLALWSALCLLILAFIRVSNPLGAVVGKSPVASFLVLGWDMGFVLAEREITFSWLAVRSKLVRFTAKNEVAAKRTILRLQRILYLGFCLDLTRSIAIMMIHFYPLGKRAFATYFHTTVAGTILLSAIACIQAGKALEKILIDGLETLKGASKEERELALTKVRAVVKEMKRAVIMPSIVALLAGWWPFLQSHLSYCAINVSITTFIVCSHLNAMQPPQRIIRHKTPKKKRTTLRRDKSDHSLVLHSSFPQSPQSSQHHSILSSSSSLTSTPYLSSHSVTPVNLTPLFKPLTRSNSAAVPVIDLLKTESEIREDEMEEEEKRRDERRQVTVELMLLGKNYQNASALSRSSSAGEQMFGDVTPDSSLRRPLSPRDDLFEGTDSPENSLTSSTNRPLRATISRSHHIYDHHHHHHPQLEGIGESEPLDDFSASRRPLTHTSLEPSVEPSVDPVREAQEGQEELQEDSTTQSMSSICSPTFLNRTIFNPFQ